jgi:hypothetical protein
MVVFGFGFVIGLAFGVVVGAGKRNRSVHHEAGTASHHP